MYMIVSQIVPSGFGENDNGTGTALEGSFHSSYSHRFTGVTSQVCGATQLLKHLPVVHGCLSLTGDLNPNTRASNRKRGNQYIAATKVYKVLIYTA